MLRQSIVGIVLAVVLAAAGPAGAETTGPLQTPPAMPTAPEPSPSPVPVATATPSITIPAGTVVYVHLKEPMASDKAKDQDTFLFEATKDVVIDGYIVIDKGAGGHGTVEHVRKAAGAGHPGRLELSFDWIYSADGLKIRLTGSDTSDGKGEVVASGASLPGTIVFVPDGLLGHTFMAGKNAVIDPTNVITVHVERTVHVAALPEKNTDRGFAR